MGKKKRRGLQIVNPKYINQLLSKMNGEKQPKIFSRIERDIPAEAKAALYKITSDFSLTDCNLKADMIKEIMFDLGFVEIGCGTNRIAFRKHNYVFKVALDERGWIDNISEYKRSIEFPQYFYKVYETNRQIIVGEYVELVSEPYFIAHRNEVRAILDILSNYYIMDDVGLTTKNYCNWGIRTNSDGSESLVLIDIAYFYPIRNMDMITCSCGGKIVPSDDFTYYRCKNSACSMKYNVPEILNMSRFDYDAEDEEAIRFLEADGTEKYIKVSGVNTGEVQTIEKTEAEQLLSSYKDATSFDASSVNIVTDIESYWNDNDDDDNVKKDPYQSLKL